MIRFILKRNFRPHLASLAVESHETLDVDVPALEAVLKRGGYGPDGHDVTVLIDAEILESPSGDHS